jgi:TPR repeat protein
MTEDANEEAIKLKIEKERDNAIQLHDLLESESADHWRKKGDESRKQAEYGAALRWYHMAADRGNAKAMRGLGCMYYSGCWDLDKREGVACNYAEAMRWWRMAADKGDDAAMGLIGYLYHNGDGAEQDYAEAIRWYRMAADKGDAFAMWNLGRGKGISKDDAEAYFWLNLVARTPNERAGRDKVGEKLTPEKRLEVEARCREWAKTHPAIHD